MRCPLLDNDLILIEEAAREAGKIAKRYFKKDPKTWDKAKNAGPVTQADLDIDHMLRHHLLSARSNYGWLSEETEDTKNRLLTDVVFIVDPIDGTRSFINGALHWGHSLAVAKNGQVQVAAVFMPMLDMMFTAVLNGGAFLNKQPVSVSKRQKIEGADILSSKANLGDEFWPGGLPNIKRSFRSSIAYRLCLVANGMFDGMLTLRPTWEWDVAAGSLIASEAGGLATDQNGQELIFNSPIGQLNGIVSSNPYIHARLMKGLR